MSSARPLRAVAEAPGVDEQQRRVEPADEHPGTVRASGAFSRATKAVVPGSRPSTERLGRLDRIRNSPPRLWRAAIVRNSIAEFEGDRIRNLRQYWNEVELIDGLGPPPED
jgi:hypothetical protein